MTQICLIPCDEIGQEVIPASAQMLQVLKLDFDFIGADTGFFYSENHGDAFPFDVSLWLT